MYYQIKVAVTLPLRCDSSIRKKRERKWSLDMPVFRPWSDCCLYRTVCLSLAGISYRQWE